MEKIRTVRKLKMLFSYKRTKKRDEDGELKKDKLLEAIEVIRYTVVVVTIVNEVYKLFIRITRDLVSPVYYMPPLSYLWSFLLGV